MVLNTWPSEQYFNSVGLTDLIWSHMAYQIMHKNCKQYYVGAKRIIININTLRSSYCWRYDAFLSFQNMMFLYIFCALFIKYSMLLLLTVSTYKNVCGYFRLIWRCQCIKGCATIPINAHLSLCSMSWLEKEISGFKHGKRIDVYFCIIRLWMDILKIYVIYINALLLHSSNHTLNFNLKVKTLLK